LNLLNYFPNLNCMEKEKLTFIEESGLMFEELGMTRMSGRVFGFLLVCDEDEVSFNQIRVVLNASKGSISTTTRQLIHAGLVEPVSLPGDRKTYFRVTKIELGQLLKNRMQLFKKLSDTFRTGIQVKEREDSVSEWLLEASVFYSWIGSQLDEVIDNWNRDKRDIINKYCNGYETEGKKRE
jgi:DNA-binding MarR family transcriptional regulator